jgi:SAM-dependent methyltransferase
MSTGWGQGYVTDCDYMPGWYGQQAPLHLATTCLMMGIACDLPADDDPVHYLELGCGLGFGALILAAANPSWRVTGVDFNPAHIASARSVARDAGIANIAFIEADLATLAEDEEARHIPPADFVSLHGVWSWVPAPVRAGIVRLLARKVLPGGVVHLSYNALPGWQPALGMQRTLRLAAEASPGRSDRQVRAGIALLHELDAAGAMHVAGAPFVKAMLRTLDDLPSSYLAHEYMNVCWNPCFHADVVADLAAAKLDFVGSATLAENFSTLMLTDQQQKIYDRFDDPVLRELVKDMCLSRGLRHDVFVRGAQRLSGRVRDTALGELALALAVPPDAISYEVKLTSGTAALGKEFYGPMFAALAEGPRRVADLIGAVPPERRTGDPREVVGILVGASYAIPLLRPGLAPQPAAVRFNRVAANWLVRPENVMKPLALATGAVGGGFPATMYDLFVQDRLAAGEDAGALDRWTAMLATTDDAEQRRGLRTMLERSVQQHLPLLRHAGVV